MRFRKQSKWILPKKGSTIYVKGILKMPMVLSSEQDMMHLLSDEMSRDVIPPLKSNDKSNSFH